MHVLIHSYKLRENRKNSSPLSPGVLVLFIKHTTLGSHRVLIHSNRYSIKLISDICKSIDQKFLIIQLWYFHRFSGKYTLELPISRAKLLCEE